MIKFLVFVVVSTLYFHGAYTQDDNLPVTQDCLGCICEGATGCNVTLTCQGEVCGPFKMTKPYWVDAGKLTANNESPDSATAYRNCALETFCSARTVQAYMKKFQLDCNGDGKIDCDDYATIHELGPYACSGQLSSSFDQRYQQCKKLVGELGRR